MSKLTAGLVVFQARLWIGTRFRHQGRLRAKPGEKGGVDCIGLVIGVGQDLGLEIFDMPGYGRDPDLEGRLLKENCDRHLKRAPRLAPGVIVLMEFGGFPRHMGILGDYPAGGLSLIHSYVEASGCVEHRLDEQWKARIIERYVYPTFELEAAQKTF